MKVLDLQCATGHSFEGWFADEQAFQQQQLDGLIQCPVCGHTQVLKLLSAPRLNLGSKRLERESHPRASQVGAPNATGLSVGPAVDIMQRARAWLAKTEDVGERFVAEARAIHGGDLPERPIRGRATAQQAQELQAEGVNIVAIPPIFLEPHH